MKLTLSIPGFENIDKPSVNAPTGLPKGTPVGGLDTGSNIIGVFIYLIIVIAICFFAYNLAYAIIIMITSGGDKERFKSGRERVRWAIIGLIFVFLSFFFVNILSGFFGVNLLNLYTPTSTQREQKPKSIDEQLMKICTDRWGQSYCTCLLNAKSTLTTDQQTQVSNAIIETNQIPQQIIGLAKSTCGDAR